MSHLYNPCLPLFQDHHWPQRSWTAPKLGCRKISMKLSPWQQRSYTWQYLCDVRKPGKHKEWTMLVLHVEAHTVSYWVTLGLWIKKISFMLLFLLLPHKYKISNLSCWLFWRNYGMKHTDKGVSQWPNSKTRTKVLKPLNPMSSTSEAIYGIGTKLSII